MWCSPTHTGENTVAYMHILANTCIYVQFTYVHIRHTCNIHAYTCMYMHICAYTVCFMRTYFYENEIRACTSDRKCTYMHVYASICMYVARMTYVYVCELYVYESMCKYVHVCNYVFASMCWGVPHGYRHKKDFFYCSFFNGQLTGSRQAKSWPRS